MKHFSIKTFFLLFIGVLSLFVIFSCGKSDDNKEKEPTVVMSESYKKGRDDFKAVTGVELPALEKLEAEDFPYEEGAKEYCFDITSGDNLNYETYLKFENFFKEKMGNCDPGFPEGNEETGRSAEWTKDNRWYQVMWDATNKAIYINTRYLDNK
ncbi:MAG: hypothetical protein J5666_09010 [Bacilli bacterium]|nr:hypothetical protein [Bacilli bacterium]